MDILGIIGSYFSSLVSLTNEMAPYLLFGFLIAGVLHVYFPQEKVNKFMGRRNLSSVVNASLFGIPLPLCSCGVIPTGISFYKNGAAKGPSVSFLISTPQTGVDSILATYSLLGLPLAIIRPIIAFITGISGGLITNAVDKNTPGKPAAPPAEAKSAKTEGAPKLVVMLRYAFVTFMQDIAKWLMIGLFFAALIDVAIPEAFFEKNLDNELLSMLLVLAASVPLYVCATGSIPIAAVLLAKGLSPGAAIVFLMAGPATNVATMTVIGNVMGRKTLIAYISSIIGGAIFFGLLVNQFLPREWFTTHLHGMDHTGMHLIPDWLKVGSSILLVVFIANAYFQRYLNAHNWKKEQNASKNKITDDMKEKIVKVKGMTCNHCKANVEKNVNALAGIELVEIDLQSEEVKITGEHIDLDEVKAKVEEIGYEYAGETK